MAEVSDDAPVVDAGAPDAEGDAVAEDAADGSIDAGGDAGDDLPDASDDAGDDAGDGGDDAAADDVGEPAEVFVEDVPALDDVADVAGDGATVLADAPADVAEDVGPTCLAGVTDQCPSFLPGPCPDLSDGAQHTLVTRGLTADLPASCEGGTTSLGGDGVLPLTLTAPSDVVITGTPTGGDGVVLTLTPAAGCGELAAELRCANSLVSGSEGVARIDMPTLAPGVYFVAVSTARGNPSLVEARVTPARPRTRGDVCPGVPVVPDGPPVTLSTAPFLADADYGTACGAGSTPAGWVDAVFSYTLSSPRDVTVEVSATGSSALSVDVSARCGQRASAVPGCVSANPARRVLRNQAPGTYYVTVDHRASTGPGRTLVATVTTAAPTPPSAADACPGVTLPAATAVSTAVAGLSAGSASFACYGGARADAVFTFTAPPLGDVLMNARASGGVAMQLASSCGGPTVAACVGPASNVWRRLRGLTPGQTYSLAAGTSATTGSLTAQWFAVSGGGPTAVSGNDACSRARTLPEVGGVFTGDSSTASTNLIPPCGGLSCASGRVAYFRLNLTERRRVVASTYGSAFDTILAVNSGSSCPGRSISNGCDDDTVGHTSQVDLTLDPGTYWIVLQGCGFRVGGSYTLDVATFAP
ncbi:MAG: hypothetical protein R3A52_05025 [Polyangiales bacterium]